MSELEHPFTHRFETETPFWASFGRIMSTFLGLVLIRPWGMHESRAIARISGGESARARERERET
jgi:hypothetical protein